LCILIWDVIIPDSTTTALWQLTAETPSSKAGETWHKMARNLVYKVSLFMHVEFIKINKSVALQALTNLGRLSSRRWQSFPTAPDGTGLTCGQHIESHGCIFSFPNRTVTSLFK
jgi:hypothetical protein